MWLKKILNNFRSNKFCDKCNSSVNGNLLCDKCQDYVGHMKKKEEEEIKAKEELKRRSWIIKRDNFLDNNNGHGGN